MTGARGDEVVQGGELQARSVRANGIDVHYVEGGAGEPLILLNNGMISANPVWAGWPSSYAAHRSALAQHFRVLELDLRGSGRTVHPGGPITYSLLADDVVAFIEALRLGRPLICGYGDGGEIATVVGIRSPGSVRAIVNHGGYDLLSPDPASPGLEMTRQMLGGSPGATQADPEAVEHSEHLRVMAELMKADHDAAQGEGHWKTVLARTFERVSRPSGYTIENLAAIAAPTLILVGDRDRFCSVDEGVAAFRALRDGELAVLPGNPGGITPAGVAATIEFFERRLATTPGGHEQG